MLNCENHGFYDNLYALYHSRLTQKILLANSFQFGNANNFIFFNFICVLKMLDISIENPYLLNPNPNLQVSPKVRYSAF